MDDFYDKALQSLLYHASPEGQKEAYIRDQAMQARQQVENGKTVAEILAVITDEETQSILRPLLYAASIVGIIVATRTLGGVTQKQADDYIDYVRKTAGFDF